MRIKKTELPPDSLIRMHLPADYTDSYQITTDAEIQATPDDIMVRFWTDTPGWVRALFQLRNFLARFVGLKGGGENDTDKLKSCIRTGGEYRFMRICAKDSRETVLLLSDKHLDAYLSVRKENTHTVSTNTLVRFHNRLGKMYFFFVKPFHRIIVRRMLERSIKMAY
jgi:hypothetical protein